MSLSNLSVRTLMLSASGGGGFSRARRQMRHAEKPAARMQKASTVKPRVNLAVPLPNFGHFPNCSYRSDF